MSHGWQAARALLLHSSATEEDEDDEDAPAFLKITRALSPRSFLPATDDFVSSLKSSRGAGLAAAPDTGADDFTPTEMAMWHIADALRGHGRMHPLAGTRRAFTASNALRPLCNVAKLSLLALSAWEPAPWCAEEPARCTLPAFHTFKVQMLPSGVSALLEGGVALLCLAELWARCTYQGGRAFRSAPPQLASCALAIGLGACALLRAAGGASGSTAAQHAAPIVRILAVVSDSARMHDQLRMYARLMGPFFSIMLLLGVHVLVFGWLGTALFPAGTAEGELHFRGLSGAAWTLIVMLTTCNFPDAALPAYEASRASLAFFMLFVMLGAWLLLSLATAVVYKSYAEQHADEQAARKEAALKGLAVAFCLLAQPDDAEEGARASASLSVPAHVAEALLVRILAAQSSRCCAREPALRARAAAAVRALGAQRGRRGGVDAPSFLTLAHALESTRATARLSAERTCAHAWCARAVRTRAHRWLVQLVLSGSLDAVVDCGLLINIGMLLAEDGGALIRSAGVEQLGSAEAGGAQWEAAELLFALAFCAEAAIKVWVLGWARYWSSAAHRFDLVVTACAAAVSVSTAWPSHYNGTGTVRLILTVRLLRVLRLLARVPRFALVASTCVEVLPAASALLCSLLSLCYVYAALGTSLFGGLVCDGPAPGCEHELLVGSDYASMSYWPMNFNSRADGMVLLFHLLLVNNWQVTTGAYALVSGWPNCTRAFFVSFYVLAVLVGLNVFQAFVLERFIDRLSTEAAERGAAVADIAGVQPTSGKDSAMRAGVSRGL